MKTIQTELGEVKLLPPTLELVRAIRSFLPFGAVGYSEPFHGANYGIVMQCGDQEVSFLRQQPPDCDAQQGKLMFQTNNLLIAHSLSRYQDFDFAGLLMPCAYLKTKGDNIVESGFAFYGCPCPEGRECTDHPLEPAYDYEFGHGFAIMTTCFISVLQQSAKATSYQLPNPVGFNVRPRLDLGTLGFGFMIVGRDLICLKTIIDHDDPVWTMLRGTGVTEVYHFPSIPAGIKESNLHIAKPSYSN